jgi:penicillin-binding protein 2
MSGHERFFSPEPAASHLRVNTASEATVRHEVMYEQSLTKIRHRPLYVGSAFSKRRFLGAFVISAVCMSGLIVRAFWMQKIDVARYEKLAEANRLRSLPIWPQRGIIRDREGKVLAENTTRFQVVMTPRDLLADPTAKTDELGVAARLLAKSVTDLLPLATATGTTRDEGQVVADQLSYEQAIAFAVKEPDLPGFDLQVRPRRRYPYSKEIPSLSHLLGYVGRLSEEEYATRREAGYRHADEIGKTGIERTYETALRGTIGERLSEVDARGRVKAMVGDQAAVDGQNLDLSLDIGLQKAAEKSLTEEMRKAGVKRGAVVAMDPRDGSILAMVSLPAYDNNAFSGSVSSTVYKALNEDPDQPLFPRAWAGTYPSGSTVKIVISAAALAEKVITPQTTVLSTGGIKVGPWFFPDWKAGGHGVTNVRKAIAWSVNTFYYYVGGGYESFVGLGVDRLTAWMRKFGLGTKSGVDLIGEANGFVPSKEWKEKAKGEKWFVGDTYNLSIGQGDLLVTPLQVAVYTSAIANGGVLVQPHVAKKDVAPRTEHLTTPEVLKTVQAGMRDNVTEGSGRALSTMRFAVSGKTGTAQWNSNRKTHAWFTAYAPSDKPEVVVTVLLEEGGEGSSVSVPVTREVLDAWYDLRNSRGGKF